MMSPLSYFCCGCSIPFGVRTALVCHLVLCCFYLCSLFQSVVLKEGSLASMWSFQTQMLTTFYSLSGVLITLAGLYGVARRMEPVVRIYLLFLAITFVVDGSALSQRFLFAEPCGTNGETAQEPGHSFGDAYLCGGLRIIGYAIFAAVMITEAYAVVVVWSFCQDVNQGTNGHDLADLFQMKAGVVFERGAVASVLGLMTSQLPNGATHHPYGSVDTPGMPAGESFFGGIEHQVAYPPASQKSL